MLMGELAKATKTKVETIRYYEREGILLAADRTNAISPSLDRRPSPPSLRAPPSNIFPRCRQPCSASIAFRTPPIEIQFASPLPRWRRGQAGKITDAVVPPVMPRRSLIAFLWVANARHRDGLAMAGRRLCVYSPDNPAGSCSLPGPSETII